MDTLNDWLVVNDMFITTSEYTDKIYIGEANTGTFKTFKRDDFYKVLKKFYKENTQEYPIWICGKCGVKYGKKPCGTATWHSDTCGVCGKWRSVTEPRDFGHLKDGWEKEKEKNT